jgi:hypothetical protein
LTAHDSNSVAGELIFDTCALRHVGTSATATDRIVLGNGSAGVLQHTLLLNTTVSVGHTNQRIGFTANWDMRGGAINVIGGGGLTTMLRPATRGQARLVGVDLSTQTTGHALVTVVTGSSAIISFEQCKLGASVALTTGTHPGQPGTMARIENSDSADTNYRMQRTSYEGTVSSETTIVRTGGASDGTTALSHKFVTTANSRFLFPLVGPEIVQWNTSTGSSKTVTVEFVHDSVTNLQDDEIWLEVEYLGTSGFPLALLTSDRMTDILSTPADQTDSSATWTTTGLTNPNTQKLVVTFTPQEIGLIRARVVLAKESYTVYVDPLLTVA